MSSCALLGLLLINSLALSGQLLNLFTISELQPLLRHDFGHGMTWQQCDEHCWWCLQSAAEARSYFEDAPGVSVVEIPINDGWARDWGPSVSALFCELTVCPGWTSQQTNGETISACQEPYLSLSSASMCPTTTLSVAPCTQIVALHVVVATTAPHLSQRDSCRSLCRHHLCLLLSFLQGRL